MTADYLDVYSCLNLRCVCRNLRNFKVNAAELRIVLIKKIASFLDLGTTKTMMSCLSSKSSSNLNDKSNGIPNEDFTIHFDSEGTPYVRGVTIYRSDERMRTKWLNEYLFSELDWSPSENRDPMQNLRRLWSHVMKNIHPLDTQVVPNRSWNVSFVDPVRWVEFISTNECSNRVKIAALFYHHHTKFSPKNIKNRLQNMIFRECGPNNKKLVGILLNPLVPVLGVTSKVDKKTVL